MDIFAQYATDETLENSGTWFDLGGDARVLVARSGNKAFGKVLTKQVELARKTLDRNDEVAEAKSQEIMIGAMAQGILLGWEGLSFKGKALDYSLDNAKTLLAVKDFRRQIEVFSNDVDAYRAKLEAEQGEA